MLQVILEEEEKDLVTLVGEKYNKAPSRSVYNVNKIAVVRVTVSYLPVFPVEASLNWR